MKGQQRAYVVLLPIRSYLREEVFRSRNFSIFYDIKNWKKGAVLVCLIITCNNGRAHYEGAVRNCAA